MNDEQESLDWGERILRENPNRIINRYSSAANSLFPVSSVPNHRYPIRGVIHWNDISVSAEETTEAEIQARRWEESHYPIREEIMMNISATVDEEAIQRARDSLGGRLSEWYELNYRRLFEISDEERRRLRESFKANAINNTACRYHSDSPYLRCAVNPQGQCEGCKDLENH